MGGEVEGEHVTLQQLLVHHLIEHWSNSLLGKSWVGHTNNGFKVISSEDGLLLLNVTEFLVLNVDLSGGLSTIAGTESYIIGDEVTHKSS